MVMRSVREIKDPKIGMHIHARTPAGAEVRGRVSERCLDRRGNVVFGLDTGLVFRPGTDVLTFYSPAPKAPRGTEGPDATRARIALSVGENFRRQRNLLAIIIGAMSAAVAIIAATALTLLFVI